MSDKAKQYRPTYLKTSINNDNNDNIRQNISFLNTDTQWQRMSNIKKAPSLSFGNSARGSRQKIMAPGPGAYELNKTSFLKGYVSFKGIKNQKIKTEAIGPSYYKPVDGYSTKKYSFTRSVQKNIKQNTPSPGLYETSLKERSRSIIFSRSPKEQISKMLIPGPSNYKIVDHLKKQMEFSFLHSKKFKESNQELSQKAQVPGPGSYDLGSVRRNLKTATFSKRVRNLMEDSKVPGPGAYQLERSSLKKQGGMISCQKRNFSYENNIPGPGNYKQVPLNLVKKSQVGIIIFKSKMLDGQQKVPGPGHYIKQAMKQKVKGGVIARQTRKSSKFITSAFNQLSKVTDHLKTVEESHGQQQMKIHQNNQNFK